MLGPPSSHEEAWLLHRWSAPQRPHLRRAPLDGHGRQRRIVDALLPQRGAQRWHARPLAEIRCERQQHDIQPERDEQVAFKFLKTRFPFGVFGALTEDPLAATRRSWR